MSKRIPLTRGKFAIVDDHNYEWLTQWKWQAIRCGRRMWYARRCERYGPRSENKKRDIYMHRVIAKAKHGEDVDHYNDDGLDNRESNLRRCSRRENIQNMRPYLKPGTSRHRGVSWNTRRQKWQAKIECSSRIHHIGFFDDESDAAVAYNDAARKYYGEFARLNIL